tara:strand:- start:143 stop:436 length:294 start_codon:yes stop_codon:yes gene_type:complete
MGMKIHIEVGNDRKHEGSIGWLKDEFSFSVATDSDRVKAIKRLEEFIHDLPQMLDQYNAQVNHSYVKTHDKFICHTKCDERYQRTGELKPVDKIETL